MSDSRPSFTGLTRFHKTTMSFAIAFCLLCAWRYGERYMASHATRDLIFAAVAGVAGVALGVYLVRFFARGI